MHEGSYKNDATIGGKWGWALSAIVGVPLLGFSIMVSTWGDWVPNEPCNHPPVWWLLLPSKIIAGLVGIGAQAAINWVWEHRRKDRGPRLPADCDGLSGRRVQPVGQRPMSVASGRPSNTRKQRLSRSSSNTFGAQFQLSHPHH